MPRRDGTGPNGEGSMTGWGMGNCNPNQNPLPPIRPVRFGRGFRNFGRGRMMYGNQFRPQNPSNFSNAEMLKQEKSFLETQKQEIERSLDSIDSRIEELED